MNLIVELSEQTRQLPTGVLAAARHSRRAGYESRDVVVLGIGMAKGTSTELGEELNETLKARVHAKSNKSNSASLLAVAAHLEVVSN